MKWLIARLREPSTWRGLVWLATSLGLTLSPEAWEYIIAIGMAAAGLLGVILKEKSSNEEVQPANGAEPVTRVVRGSGAGRVRPNTVQAVSDAIVLPARSSGPSAKIVGNDLPGWNDR
jgi:hypothetical protein